MNLPINYDAAPWQVRKQAREEYVQLQQGKCCHCGQPLSGPPPAAVLSKRIDKKLFPPTMFLHPVHLHHDHDTGMTIGAVHSVCNAVLWQYHGK